MESTPAFRVSRLVRELRRQACLTQQELARRVGTTQSVISRLESDDYEGHSLSMLYRIAAALDRRIVVTTVGEDGMTLAVHEGAPSYGTVAGDARQDPTPVDLDRLAERLAQRFEAQGVTKADVQEAIRWARGEAAEHAIEHLRSAIEVGPGDVVDDVRRARARRGAARDMES